MVTTDTDLRISDRCDRCGARASIRGQYDLLFCQHHGREHGLIDPLPQRHTATSGTAGRAET